VTETMAYTIPSPTISLTLDEVIGRLSRRPEIVGVMVIGSTGGEHFKPYSDYDLLLVLDKLPVALRSLLTHIDGRLADVFFRTFGEIDRVMTSNDPATSASEAGRLIYWMQYGTIRYDPTGRLKVGQKLLSIGDWIQDKPSDSALYDRWNSTNYYIAQNRRMLQADDPVYDTALALRFHHLIFQLWTDYFRVRGLPSRSEKLDARYLTDHDMPFLEKFRQLLATSDLAARQTLFEKVAAEVFAPFAPMWESGVTGVAVEGGRWQTDPIREALKFWQTLCRASTST